MKLVQVLAIVVLVVLVGAVPLAAEATGSAALLSPDARAMKERGNQVIIDWNVYTQDASGANSPPRRARTFAMVSIAVHDALNGIENKYARYASSARDPLASPVAAAAQAAHDVLVELFPEQQADLDAKLAASLDDVKDQGALARGVALGAAAAADLLALRANDGSNVVTPYTPTLLPGRWRPTPPVNAPALEPGWGNVTPFGLTSGNQFRSPAPYELDSAEYAADWVEVRDYGSANSTLRSDDQTSYAHFWYEPSAVGWNRLARAALALRHKNIWKSARLFALMNMAIADGYIASFDSKYHFDNWRPITAIREADTDGNPATNPEPAWTALRPTPPIPDQTSGHAVAGFAARAALVEVFGEDVNEPITMTSTTAVPPGSTRSWDSFTQAAHENAESRIVVGIHFRKACDDGETQGRAVGDWIVDNYFGEVNK